MYDRFRRAGAEVFGVSADSPNANAGFAAKHNLKVGGLLTDKGWQLLEAFGLREHNGKVFKRITFVIGTDGKVKLAYYYTGQGDVADHAKEALKAVAG